MSEAVKKAYTLETFLYFDLETIPCQDAAYLAELRKNVKPPATYKKAESIERWMNENADAEALNALAKTSFDGGAGHICTIAWAKNDSQIKVLHAETIEQERDILVEFFADFDAYHAETLVGHNINHFDLRFLRQRAIVLGVKMPDGMPRDPKAWDKASLDTMTAWAGSRDTVGLDKLCKILGIPGKDGFDGSMVAAAWANGEHETIAEYCKNDTMCVREIHKKFLEAGW